jgi:hypothetical protein
MIKYEPVALDITDNILIGENAGLLAQVCPTGARLNAFRHNLTSAPFTMVYGAEVADGCTPTSGFVTMDDTFNELKARQVADTTQNRRITTTADCVGDGRCLSDDACTDPVACASALFAPTWDIDDGGLTALFGDGWQLASPAHCFIAQLGFDYDPPVEVDHYDARRDKPTSVGAQEVSPSSNCAQ